MTKKRNRREISVEVVEMAVHPVRGGSYVVSRRRHRMGQKTSKTLPKKRNLRKPSVSVVETAATVTPRPFAVHVSTRKRRGMKNRTSKISAWVSAANMFEKWAHDFELVARGTTDLGSRAAIMREVAHYLECAARLRGTPILGLKPKALRWKKTR